MEEQYEAHLMSAVNRKENLRFFSFKKPFPKQLLCCNNLVKHTLILGELPYKRQDQRDILFLCGSKGYSFLHFSFLLWSPGPLQAFIAAGFYQRVGRRDGDGRLHHRDRAHSDAGVVPSPDVKIALRMLDKVDRLLRLSD